MCVYDVIDDIFLSTRNASEKEIKLNGRMLLTSADAE